MVAEQKMPSMACPAHTPPCHSACFASKKFHRGICVRKAGQCSGQSLGAKIPKFGSQDEADLDCS
eukprot:599179-Pelagomonas_calceolata.AAC.1